MINKVLYILGQLTDDDADWLGGIGRRVRVKQGGVLIQRGVRLDNLYFVLDGELQVRSPKGDEIARVGTGDIVGELSLLDENPTSADVVALGPVKVLAVRQSLIHQRIAEDPAFAARFYKALAMLLALRMRATLSRFGAGDEPATTIGGGTTDAATANELREAAAGRFERMVRKLWRIQRRTRTTP